MPRTTKSKSQRDHEQQQLAGLEAATERARRDLEAAAARKAEEEALKEKDAELDGRHFDLGTPLPGHAAPAINNGRPLPGPGTLGYLDRPDLSLEQLRAEAERLEEIAERHRTNARHAGAHIRAQTLRNVESAENEAYRARLLYSDADALAREYGGLAPCRNQECSNETPRSADYVTFGWCRDCYARIPKGA